MRNTVENKKEQFQSMLRKCVSGKCEYVGFWFLQKNHGQYAKRDIREEKRETLRYT